MKLTRIYQIAAVALVAELVVSAWGLAQVGLTATVPIHWDAEGNPNGYGPALLGFLLVPAITIGIAVMFSIIPMVEPRRENLQRSASAYRTVAVATTVLMFGIHIVVVLAGTGRDAPVALIVGGGVGLLFAAMGNVLTTVRSNYMFGVRTPWTLSSELSWDKTHRLVGRLFVVAGIGVFAASLLGQLLLVFWLLMGSVVVVLVVGFAYSYLVWRDDPDRRPTSGAR
jgi:uncharacterized membrane protein